LKFEYFLAWKYLKPKRSVASAIQCVSVLGVMLGVAVVIIVRSIMTGFGDIWEEKILDFKPHISMVSVSGRPIQQEDAISSKIKEIRNVTAVTPEIDTRVLLSHNGKVLAPVLIGVNEEAFASSYKLGRPVAGAFDLSGDSIVLGVNAARSLGVWVGDEVVVYSPKTLVDQDEIFLPVKWKVAGVFSCGQYDYDSGYAVASLNNLRELMGMENGVFAIHIKTSCPTDPVKFNTVMNEVKSSVAHIPNNIKAVSWRDADREIFNALAVEKNMTALLLMLVSLVAVFCVMNTLLVLTVQKTPEIGLLKALGFSRFQIMNVFVVHGVAQCTMGIILGLLVSWAVLSNLQGIVEYLAVMGLEVFPASVYGLAAIPHRLIISDVFWVVGMVFVFGLVASLIPAFLASVKDPVKALNQ
jgi:lipoprotein-releasing system permease protein